MQKADVIVLGAGIIGTSVALHLAKRGVSVILADKRAPGEETSYGNAGVIEGSTVFPPTFPSNIGKILQVALKRAPEANYHLSHLPRVLPWLFSYRAATRPAQLVRYAYAMRPLFEHAIMEHELLMRETGATQYLRTNGWLKVFRQDKTYDAMAGERALASILGISYSALTTEEALSLEPYLSPVFRRAIHCQDAASVSNPLAVTKAYAARFQELGGAIMTADARTLIRHNYRWRIRTERDFISAEEIVMALGPWTPDVLSPLGIRLPLAVKRGYHWHFTTTGDATLTRPTLDAEIGYYMSPMQQGIRMTTGVEFAARDAPPTPVQFERILPRARELFPLGKTVEPTPWMGCRPCFPDSMPVIGRAPRQHAGVWLAYGHAHWGLTLGPATGRLLAEMMTGETPFCDPAPYSAKRFSQ